MTSRRARKFLDIDTLEVVRLKVECMVTRQPEYVFVDSLFPSTAQNPKVIRIVRVIPVCALKMTFRR